MFKLQQDRGNPLRGPFGKKVNIDMEVELDTNGHAQKGEGGHEHIARNLFHPRDSGRKEISHDDIRRDDNHLEGQEDACQEGTDKMDPIQNISYFHKSCSPLYKSLEFLSRVDSKPGFNIIMKPPLKINPFDSQLEA
jgi:hypothetical protein